MKKRRGQRPKRIKKNNAITNIDCHINFTNSFVYDSEEFKKIVLEIMKEATEKNI